MTSRRRVDSTLLFSLTIPGLVQPKQSVRVTSKPFPHGFQPAKVKNYEAYVRVLAAESWRVPSSKIREVDWYRKSHIDQPVSLRIVIYLPRPKSRAKRHQYPDRRPDWLNLVKPIEDSIVKAGVLCDDGRVVHADVWKLYADETHPAGVEVELHSMQDLGRAL